MNFNSFVFADTGLDLTRDRDIIFNKSEYELEHKKALANRWQLANVIMCIL